MTSRAAAAGQAAISALWAPRSWRATLHALTGLMIQVATGFVLGLWILDLFTLKDGPGSDAVLNAFYVIVAVAGPVPLLWWLGALSAVQRVRFQKVLGIEIPAPPRAPGRWPQRLVGGWRGAAAWRHLGYNLLAVVTGLGGGLAVAACWAAPLVAATYPRGLPVGEAAAPLLAAALFLAAPWVARAVADVDERAARALLGPSAAEQLELRVAALARSRSEVVAAADAERRRIERDLHDGAQQQLVALAMNLGMARAALGDDVSPATRKVIEQAHEDAVAALAGLRELVRGLHPAVLNDRGLDAALSGIVARAPLAVRLRFDVSPRCSPIIEAIAYFTVSETLTNIARHARANAAEITVQRAGGRLKIVVTDDGRGGATAGADGTGLRGLAQRAAAVDGSLIVHSPAGGPTTITAELPCE
ncbi:MAG TPA: histidine kinase [Streptosporangiaceae bacterium]